MLVKCLICLQAKKCYELVQAANVLIYYHEHINELHLTLHHHLYIRQMMNW